MENYFSKKIKKKYKVDSNQFSSGVYFIFNGFENPYSESVSQIFKGDINASLKSDLIEVGNDFKQVIDLELAQ